MLSKLSLSKIKIKLATVTLLLCFVFSQKHYEKNLRELTRTGNYLILDCHHSLFSRLNTGLFLNSKQLTTGWNVAESLQVCNCIDGTKFVADYKLLLFLVF